MKMQNTDFATPMPITAEDADYTVYYQTPDRRSVSRKLRDWWQQRRQHRLPDPCPCCLRTDHLASAKYL